MNILFRVDASVSIGNGHVSRCRSLAHALRESFGRCRVSFACAELPPLWDGVLAEERIEVVRIDSRLLDPPIGGVLRLEQDARAIIDIACKGAGRFDWVIVDHYGIEQTWETMVREVAGRVLVIDDLANRPHDCDILVDQNFDDRPLNRYGGRVPASARQLLGPGYAILRPEFAVLRRRVLPRSGCIKSIVILLGPSDVHDVTGKSLEAIRQVGRGGLRVDVVLGGDHPHADRIASLACDCGARVHRSLASMAQVFADADLAIGAAGVSALERICLRLPSLFTTIADNQRPVARALAAIVPTMWLGPSEEVTARVISDRLRLVLDGSHPDLSMDRMPEVDGLGASRIASEMLAMTP